MGSLLHEYFEGSQPAQHLLPLLLGFSPTGNTQNVREKGIMQT